MLNPGEKIRSLREEKGLSQAKLSELLQVNQAFLSSVELGKQEPKADFLSKTFSLLMEISSEEIANLKKKRTRHAGTIKRERTIEELKYIPSKKHKAVSTGPTAISLFSGCGGMCLGFENAGFQILGYVEINAELRDIYKLNFPRTQLLGDDITQISDDEVKGWLEVFPPIDVIFGGPPCQGFSLAGKRNVNDPRNMLFTHMVRFADILRPRYVVFENVRLLTSMKAPDGSFIHSHIKDAFAKVGYRTHMAEMNVMAYGVPQFRERVILIAVRNDLPALKQPFPAPTHGQPSSTMELFAPALTRYRTFREATQDLPSLEPGEVSPGDPLHFAVAHPPHVVEWLRHTPEGCSAHENQNPKHRPPSGYNTTYKRLRWDEPSSTIQTTFGMISASRSVHPSDNRSLTIREAMRCQTFPDDFCIAGKIGTVRTAIGNALPPLFAEVIAKHLLQVGKFEVKEVKESCRNTQLAN